VRNRAAIIGAGVSGLTCGIVFAEREWNVTIFANETGQETTSAAAGAVWFPYHAEPIDKVIPWLLTTYGRLRELARDSRTGVSMLELHHFTRTDEIPIPDWAKSLGRAPNLRHPERKSRSGSDRGTPRRNQEASFLGRLRPNRPPHRYHDLPRLFGQPVPQRRRHN
jgi:glycine/D-amino acid oxidase-like deaminating enzyme